MTTSQRLSYPTIDDYLGPSEDRFFGAGYRRVNYRIGQVEVAGAQSDAGVRSTVSVDYPRHWSTKAQRVDLRPHLSTVDTLVLAAQLSEIYLAHTFGLDEQQRRQSWLRKVTLRAGGAPQEELTDMPMSATLRRSAVSEQDAGLTVSLFDCQVGLMRARCEIEHPTGRVVDAAAVYQDFDDVLGAAGRRYYGDAFKDGRQRLRNVEVDLAELQASADVEVQPTPAGAHPVHGLEGGYPETVSLIDCFVTNLQLAQVLLYELDHVRREDTNTLWMIQTVLQATSPHRPRDAALTAHAAVTGKQILRVNGANWRSADISGSYAGITLRSTFGHELADHVAAAAS